jgi:hypothetical protein
MRDIFVVLSEKEAELKKLQVEIETLRAAARLLSDETDNSRKTSSADSVLSVVREPGTKEQRVASGGLKQFP